MSRILLTKKPLQSPIVYLLAIFCAWSVSLSVAQAGEEFGPPNLLRTLKTPFAVAGSGQEEDSSANQNVKGDPLLQPISLGKATPSRVAIEFKKKSSSNIMCLPERITIGHSAKFTVKGKPGSYVAIAMADRDSGAKPLLGNPIRLGPDRKVMTVGTIGENGLAELYITAPIEGDMIGQFLFFEAAVWSKPDMSDAQIAQTLAFDKEHGSGNGVMVGDEAKEKKHGIKFGATAAIPMYQDTSGASNTAGASGQP